jgi:competence protein ComEC
MKRSLPYILLIVLLLINGGVLVIAYTGSFHSHHLKVSVLNIGQGDSILVQGPTGSTILIDGGPDQSVMRDLGTELGPLRRHIDMVIETHPDADHITGLLSVLQQYRIDYFMTSDVPGTTQIMHTIETTVNALPSLRRITARRGMRIQLGGGAYADVLHPDRNLTKETVTNDASITLHLVYGRTSFMLTGDLPTPVENWLVTLDSGDGELKTDVLKVGHHGSKYSSGSIWLAALNPSYAAISVGKKNRYGHPSPEALGRLQATSAQVSRTDESGTLTYISDGTNVTETREGL